jgi:hypothetical protein
LLKNKLTREIVEKLKTLILQHMNIKKKTKLADLHFATASQRAKRGYKNGK